MTFGVEEVRVDLGGRAVLRDVDLQVPGGSVVAVVGGDGAGKSTLLRCLVGRVVPSAGVVRRPDRERVGYMPATSGTWRDLTVDENIDFVAQAFDMPAADRNRRRAELLERAGLTEASDRLAGHLSGGMRQKLGFVSAMLHEPDLLVLDEPSTGVDPVSRVELWRLIAEAAADGTAVVLATTYLDEAERASSVTVLDAGVVLAAGTLDEVMASIPGTITSPDVADDPARAWRRGPVVREWHPAGAEADAGGMPAGLDLEDGVIALMLQRRAGAETGGTP